MEKKQKDVKEKAQKYSSSEEILEEIRKKNLTEPQKKALLEYIKNPYVKLKRPAIEIPQAQVKFGVVSDTHLNSKYSSLDFLYALYDRFAKEKVDFVAHCGDMTDGEGIEGNLTEVLNHGAQEVIDYVAKVYPDIGVKTYFISGKHDATYIKRERIDICSEISNKRKDLVYICQAEDLLQGTHQGDIKVGKSVIKLLYPLDRQPYASSYPIQKIIQSFGGGHKPQVLILGAYHKVEQFEPREVCAIQAGSTQYQTPWRLTHKVPSVLGGWVVELQVQKDGQLKNSPKFTVIPFYE